LITTQNPIRVALAAVALVAAFAGAARAADAPQAGNPAMRLAASR